jgi:hypothetical protein
LKGGTGAKGKEKGERDGSKEVEVAGEVKGVAEDVVVVEDRGLEEGKVVVWDKGGDGNKEPDSGRTLMKQGGLLDREEVKAREKIPDNFILSEPEFLFPTHLRKDR